MPDRPWKAEERTVARLFTGRRHWANQGGRVDVEAATILCQVKHRRVCSLAALERLAVELEALGRQQGKAGLVVVKRRAGRGLQTPRLIVMTEATWRLLTVAEDRAPVTPADTS